MSVYIIDDEQRRDRLASSVTTAAILLTILLEATPRADSRRSRCRISFAPAALGTRPLLILGRAPSL
jgi:hypothetical protein